MDSHPSRYIDIAPGGWKWTLNRGDTKIDGTKAGQSNRTIDLHSSNGTLTYTAYRSDDKMYVYRLSDGQRRTGNEWPLTSGNDYTRGIWSGGTTMWVSDLNRKHIFAYRLSDGYRRQHLDIDLHPDNKKPRGLTGAGNRIWTADQDDEWAYAYRIPNRPPVPSDPTLVTLTVENEHGEEIADVDAHDPDGDTVEFKMQDEADQPYRIDQETGVITTHWPVSKAKPGRTLILRIGIRDKKRHAGEPARNEEPDATVNVTVVMKNTPPQFILDDTTWEVRNLEDDPLTWDVLDAGSFRIDSEGVITVGGSLHYETVDTYNMTVAIRETDSNTEVSADSREVIITILNVDEPGEVTLSSQNPTRNTPLTASLTDPDGGVVIDRWTWETATDFQSEPWTRVAGHDGTGSFTPNDEHRGSHIRATAHYEDGHGAMKSAHGTTSGTVHNRHPVFIQPESDSLTLIMPRGALAELRFDGPKVSDPDNDPVDITHTFRKPGDSRETAPGEMLLAHRAAEFNELFHPATGVDIAAFTETYRAGTGETVLTGTTPPVTRSPRQRSRSPYP